jgi:hypothetical protein
MVVKGAIVTTEGADKGETVEGEADRAVLSFG